MKKISSATRRLTGVEQMRYPEAVKKQVHYYELTYGDKTERRLDVLKDYRMMVIYYMSGEGKMIDYVNNAIYEARKQRFNW